jgi:hypothetical protein
MGQHTLGETIVILVLAAFCIIDGIRRLTKSDYALSPNQWIYIGIMKLTGRSDLVDEVTERFLERNQRMKLGLWYLLAGVLLIGLYFFEK